MYRGRESFVRNGMQSCIMTHVNNVCLSCPYPLSYSYCISYRLMRAMRIDTQSIDDQDINSA